MKQPLLTVIIPAYNAADYIRGCLDSIIVQDCFNDSQIIVVDDGSKDSTAKIVQGYTHRFPNIELHSQPNSGVSVARNRGLDLARGEYISFVDSDDMVGAVYENCAPYLRNTKTPFYCGNMVIVYGQCQGAGPTKPLGDNKYFSRMIDAARNNKSEIAFGGKVTVNGELYDLSTLIYASEATFDESAPSKYSIIKQSDSRESANFAVYRHDFLKQHKLRFEPDMLLDEDILFCMLAALYAKNITTVPDSLYFYQRHPGSLTTYMAYLPDSASFRRYSSANIQRYGSFLQELAKYPQYADTFKKYMREYCAMSYLAIKSHMCYFPLPDCCYCSNKTCEGCETCVKNLARIERGLKRLMPNREHTK